MARTHDELWNEAQRSYLDHGWMHNRLRMLWGKAVLQWTPDAETCLRIDRPFYPRPIYGTVRYLSLKAEAKRRQGKR